MSNQTHFNNNVYQMIEKLMTTDARSITIKTKKAKIVFKLKDGSVTGSIYKKGSMEQVWMHGKNSITELMAMFEAMGIGLYELAKGLMPTSLFQKKRDPLLLHLTTKTD